MNLRIYDLRIYGFTIYDLRIISHRLHRLIHHTKLCSHEGNHNFQLSIINYQFMTTPIQGCADRVCESTCPPSPM